jgi:predicted lipoprotein with Yx(FWY)xxD motif
MKFNVLPALLAAATLAACGGGGSGGTSGGGMVPAPVPAPSTAPTSAPTNAPASAPASTATIKGAPGFASPNGLTLYVFGADTPNVSNCNAGCDSIWPPFMAGANAKATGSFTIITRQDGSKQWAYKSQPLYNFSGDAKAGDANGDGLNLNGGIWHVARP